MKKHYFLQILFKVRDELPMLTIVKNHFYPRSDQNIEIQPQIKYTSANHRCVSYVCDVCFQIDRFDCHTYLLTTARRTSMYTAHTENGYSRYSETLLIFIRRLWSAF